MHTVEFHGTDIRQEYPESALEFTAQQLMDFSRLMLLYESGKLSFQHFKVRLSYALLNMGRSVDFKDKENLEKLDALLRISKLAEGFFMEEERNGKKLKVAKMEFYIQQLAKLKISGRVFHGPESALFNTTFGEYIQALTAFVDYSRSGDEAMLDTMIATLYRPKKWFNGIRKWLPNYSQDKRRAFNPSLTSHYAKKLKHLAPEVKRALYYFFASCQNFIATNDSLDIGGGNVIDVSQLFKKAHATENTPKGLGMVGSLYIIAETGALGDSEKVAKQNTYDVLAFLVHQAEKRKREIEELKKQKRNAAVRRPRGVRR